MSNKSCINKTYLVGKSHIGQRQSQSRFVNLVKIQRASLQTLEGFNIKIRFNIQSKTLKRIFLFKFINIFTLLIINSY